MPVFNNLAGTSENTFQLGPDKNLPVAKYGPVFLDNYNTPGSTTQTTMQLYRRFAITVPETQWYELNVTLSAAMSGANKRGGYEIKIDSTIITTDMMQLYPALADVWTPLSWCDVVQLAAGSHNIDINYRVISGTSTPSVKINRSRIFLMGVK